MPARPESHIVTSSDATRVPIFPAAHEPASTKSASTVCPIASCVSSPTSEGERITRLRPPSG